MAKSKKNKTNKAPRLPKALRTGALPRSVEDVFAAGLGALSTAGKKGAESFETLVGLGQRVAETGSDAARAAVTEVESAAGRAAAFARDTGGGVVDGAADRVEGVVEGVLARLGVPGRDEVAALQAQVDALNTRIAALAAESTASTVTDATAAVFEVVSHERGWAVQKAGAERATSVHGTKKEALADGRRTARAHAPSRLRVFKTDGTLADETDYQA